MSLEVRVFVNEIALDVAAGTTVLEAVAALDPVIANGLSSGGYLTDGVGREIEPGSPVEPGLIVRVVAAAARAQSEE